MGADEGKLNSGDRIRGGIIKQFAPEQHRDTQHVQFVCPKAAVHHLNLASLLEIKDVKLNEHARIQIFLESNTTSEAELGVPLETFTSTHDVFGNAEPAHDFKIGLNRGRQG